MGMFHFSIASALIFFSCAQELWPQASPLRLSESIPLTNVDGRIDHLAVDLAGERLFVCALGNNTVEVIDLRKSVRIHSISGLGAPQGVAYIPSLDRLVVANNQGGRVNIYDGKSFQALGELSLG